jgi:septal ring factor EnvC (AmiA/AmiB activator)
VLREGAVAEAEIREVVAAIRAAADQAAAEAAASVALEQAKRRKITEQEQAERPRRSRGSCSVNSTGCAGALQLIASENFTSPAVLAALWGRP